MANKTINVTCTIGDFPISNKAIKSLDIERNFSDVSNKFSLILLDTPQTGLTDLELYMCAGNRTIRVAYNDNPDQSGFVSFKGQIWDYTSAFVGNIKQLTISGYISRVASISEDTAGTALYNIDWNNYYCMRKDTSKIWNVSEMEVYDNARHFTWLDRNKRSYGEDRSEYIVENQNVVVYKDFASKYNTNTLGVKIRGPKGTISLPVPDSFAPMVFKTYDPDHPGDDDYVIYEGDENDPEGDKGKLWGPLDVKFMDTEIYTRNDDDWEEKINYVDFKKKNYTLKDDGTVVDINGDPVDTSMWDTYWVDKDDNIRAFKMAGSNTTPYIQLNPQKDYFGSGVLLKSNLGVDPSYIVKQLCELEGWDYDDSTVVQTSMVPCSDSFKMNNQSALQYISEVLAPLSITPVGVYKDVNGNEVHLNQGEAGYTCWFDSNNKFHFEPLSNLYTKDKTDIVMGYNIPNSPVISFQVDTKGTCFYTTNAQEINSIFITTGQQVTSIDVTSQEYINEYNKVKGHNESLDEFFGYSYEQIKSKYDKSDESATNGLYLGFGKNATISTNLDASKYNDNLTTIESDSDSDYVTIVSSAVQKNLVTTLSSSGITDSTSLAAQLKAASSKIEQFMITATMNIWANPVLHPSCLIRVTNMVRGVSDYVQRHPTSGDYLILKQVDKISGDSFTQQLSLIRANATLYDNVNPQKIDYSKAVTEDLTKTESEERAIRLQAFNEENKKKAANSSVITRAKALWIRYMTAFCEKHPDLIWWKYKHVMGAPGMVEDLVLLKMPITAACPEGWYTWPTIKIGSGYSTGFDNTPELPDFTKPENITLHPSIKSWFDLALKDEENGVLGAVLRHVPVTADAATRANLQKYTNLTGGNNFQTPVTPTIPNNRPTLEVPGNKYGNDYLLQSNNLYQNYGNFTKK